MKKITFLACCLLLSSTCFASNAVISAPGVEIGADGTITAPGVEIKTGELTEVLDTELESRESKPTTISVKNMVISVDNEDREITLEDGRLVVTGSNNDIKISGTVVAISITGSNNDIQYPQANENVQVVNVGSNNDVVTY